MCALCIVHVAHVMYVSTAFGVINGDKSIHEVIQQQGPKGLLLTFPRIVIGRKALRNKVVKVNNWSVLLIGLSPQSDSPKLSFRPTVRCPAFVVLTELIGTCGADPHASGGGGRG